MRDPNRIPKTLKAVEKLWKANPDWRLGQLIVNISRSAGYGDHFFIEDDRLVKEITQWEGEENAQQA